MKTIEAFSHPYPAKLLLFGEYTVLSGSQALAVPLHQWSGGWIMDNQFDLHALPEYYNWLKQTGIISEVTWHLMLEDMERGWRYKSDIPIGYGLGSSGALVAALYDRYVSPQEDEGMTNAAESMAKMESFFHGSSSGMDPLVSYSQQAVLKDDRGAFHIIEDTGWPKEWKVYLLDSGTGRTTGDLVREYNLKLEEDTFKRKVQRELIPMVDHAIHFYLSSVDSMLEECIQVISQFQRSYFANMIPEEVKQKWDELSGHRGVYVKLCGAGGGGYFLIINTQGIQLDGQGLIQV